MKIVVGNNRFAKLGGSETYSYAFIEELVRRGHDVIAVGKEQGIVSNKLKDLGVPVYTKRIQGAYDVLFLSHKTSIELVKECKGFKVQTCHGIFPKLEQPVLGMDAYVGITEEVKNHLKNKGFKSTVIYNGINCDRFKSIHPVNQKLKKVLSLVHGDKANAMIKQACKKIGCDLIIHNKLNGACIWEMEDLINSVDLVIGVGRSIFEAASCERNVVIFDYRSYMDLPLGDGILTDVDFKDYLTYNCTGRYSKNVFNVNQLVFEMELYNSSLGKRLRDFVLKNMNIQKQVDKYLNLVR